MWSAKTFGGFSNHRVTCAFNASAPSTETVFRFAGAASAGFGASGFIACTRSISERSFRRRIASSPPERSPTRQASKWKSIGARRSIVARNLLSRACASLSSRRCFSAPFMEGAISSAFSSVPYWATSFVAVFSPTPGTPGMLSELSPISPFTSIICVGVTPYFS